MACRASGWWGGAAGLACVGACILSGCERGALQATCSSLRDPTAVAESCCPATGPPPGGATLPGCSFSLSSAQMSEEAPLLPPVCSRWGLGSSSGLSVPLCVSLCLRVHLHVWLLMSVRMCLRMSSLTLNLTSLVPAAPWFLVSPDFLAFKQPVLIGLASYM